MLQHRSRTYSYSAVTPISCDNTVLTRLITEINVDRTNSKQSDEQRGCKQADSSASWPVNCDGCSQPTVCVIVSKFTSKWNDKLCSLYILLQWRVKAFDTTIDRMRSVGSVVRKRFCRKRNTIKVWQRYGWGLVGYRHWKRDTTVQVGVSTHDSMKLLHRFNETSGQFEVMLVAKKPDISDGVLVIFQRRVRGNKTEYFCW